MRRREICFTWVRFPSGSTWFRVARGGQHPDSDQPDQHHRGLLRPRRRYAAAQGASSPWRERDLGTVTRPHLLPALGKSTTESRDVRPRSTSVPPLGCRLFGGAIDPTVRRGSATYGRAGWFGEKGHECAAPIGAGSFVRSSRSPQSGIAWHSTPSPRIHRTGSRNSRHSAYAVVRPPRVARASGLEPVPRPSAPELVGEGVPELQFVALEQPGVEVGFAFVEPARVDPGLDRGERLDRKSVV